MSRFDEVATFFFAGRGGGGGTALALQETGGHFCGVQITTSRAKSRADNVLQLLYHGSAYFVEVVSLVHFSRRSYEQQQHCIKERVVLPASAAATVHVRGRIVWRGGPCAVLCTPHATNTNTGVTTRFTQSVDPAPVRDWATSSKRPHACKSQARRCCCCVQYVNQ